MSSSIVFSNIVLLKSAQDEEKGEKERQGYWVHPGLFRCSAEQPKSATSAIALLANSMRLNSCKNSFHALQQAFSTFEGCSAIHVHDNVNAV